MKSLRNKTALVTGAAMGMGRVLSEMLLKEGCRLILVDIQKASLENTARELSGLGECKSFVCDISDRNEVYKLARKIERDAGPVSILVNNAGIVQAAPVMEMKDEMIEKMLNVNLAAQFWTVKAFLPAMKSQNEGHIVNFASAGGILAIPNIAAYCASKFGVVGFTDALRQEMKKQRLNIGVTMVCPNTVNTGMFDGSKMVAGTKMLSPVNVCKAVIKGIKKNRAMVAVPSLPVKFMTPLSKVLLPVHAMDWMNRALGMWDANDTWHGRGK
jgi:all-trans-retinol dehydrogenase (NAD+)